MSSTFPTAQAEVTAEWLSEQLPQKVESFTINKIGMGFTADAHKIEAKMADGSDQIYILKLPHSLGLEKQKQHANDCKIEVIFYREFADKVPIKTCKHYAACIDEKEPWKWCLLLDNLATPDMMEFPLWFGNPTIYPDPNIYTEVVPAVQAELAKMHAWGWKHELLDSHPICQVQKAGKGLNLTCGLLCTGLKLWQPFRDTGMTAGEYYWTINNEESCKLLGVEDLSLPVVQKSRAFLKRLCTEEGRLCCQKICQVLDKGPHTFIHGDGHPGNVFYNKKDRNLTFIDFQLVGRAPPGVDLVQSMMLVIPSDPSGNHKKYVQAYYDKLVEAKPEIREEYSFETCFRDYRWAMVVYYAAVVLYDIDNKITMIREVKEGGRESSPLVQAMGLVNLFEKYYGNMQDLGLYNIFDEVEANSA